MNTAIENHLAVLSAVADFIADLGHERTASWVRGAVRGIADHTGATSAQQPPAGTAYREPEAAKPARRKAAEKPAASASQTDDEARAAGAKFENAPVAVPATIERLLDGARKGLTLATMAQTTGRPREECAKDAFGILSVEWKALDKDLLAAWAADNEALLSEIASVSPGAAGAVESQIRAKVRAKLGAD